MPGNWLIKESIDPLRKIWAIIILQFFYIDVIIMATYLRYVVERWPFIFIMYGFTYEYVLLIFIMGIALCVFIEWEILGN